MQRIHTRLNLWFLVFILFIFTTIYFCICSFQRDTLRNSQKLTRETLNELIRNNWRQKVDAIAIMLTDQLVQPMREHDMEAVRSITAAAHSNNLALSMIVVDKEDNILAGEPEPAAFVGMRYDPATMRTHPTVDAYLVRFSIRSGARLLGYVIMEFNKTEASATRSGLGPSDHFAA